MIVDFERKTMFKTTDMRRQYHVKKADEGEEKTRSDWLIRYADPKCVQLKPNNPPHYVAKKFEISKDIAGCDYPSMESIIQGISAEAQIDAGNKALYSES